MLCYVIAVVFLLVFSFFCFYRHGKDKLKKDINQKRIANSPALIRLIYFLSP